MTRETLFAFTRRVVSPYAQIANEELAWAEKWHAALVYITKHPNGVGDHHPAEVARAALEGRALPRV